MLSENMIIDDSKSDFGLSFVTIGVYYQILHNYKMQAWQLACRVPA